MQLLAVKDTVVVAVELIKFLPRPVEFAVEIFPALRAHACAIPGARLLDGFVLAR